MESVSYSDLANQMDDIQRNLNEQNENLYQTETNTATTTTNKFDVTKDLPAKAKVLYRGTAILYTLSGLILSAIILLMSKENSTIKIISTVMIFIFLILALMAFFKPDMLYGISKAIPMIGGETSKTKQI